MPCPSCGADLPADAAFCLKCGARLSGVAAVVAPADPLRTILEKALGYQYEIVRLIGQGGMGAVYLAREKALDRLVAIKVLPPDAAASPESRERFRREARTAAKLTHPNIVPLHTFGDVEGTLFFVMGYVRGASLAERMRRQGGLPADEVRRIVGELADALDYAHRLGVVHRDVKPDNVLMDDESGRPMLTDFGVAKAQGGGATLTDVGAAIGTPHYMSPEQAAGEREIDGRSDLYALGVMGYQMLSGRLPFEGDDPRHVMLQHMTRDPVPLSALVPKLEPDLAMAVMRCLAKEREGRWPDGAALHRALARGAEDEDELPEAVEGVRSALFATPAATGVIGVITLASQLWKYPDGGFSWATMLVPLLLPVGAAASALAARRHGIGFRDAFRMALREPAKWRFWWPARLRHRHSIWPRLPAAIRRIRAVFAGAFAAMCVGAVAELVWLAPVAPALKQLAGVVAAACFGGFGVAAYGAMGVGYWWARRHGLKGVQDRAAFVFGGAKYADRRHRFWREPHIARLLLPAPEPRAELATPQGAAGYVRAIAAAVPPLTGPARELASDAAEAARQLLGSLETLDREIGALAHDADPAETARLEQRLAGLGAEAPGEGEERRQMRTLLSGQLELARRLAVRLDAAAARRAKLEDLLRTLWLQVANLRASGATAQADTEVTGRIRVLCEDIARHGEAATEVSRLVSLVDGALPPTA